MSEPEYEGKVSVTYLRVKMSDSTELSTKITRPDADGQLPAVMEYNPYRRLYGSTIDYREEKPPVVPFLAERGYAVVQFEARGTGNSGGYCADIYNEDERRDGHDMVEWIAAQPWCNGNVGMFGKSFGAVVQWQVAVQAPPHLKAIIVRSGNNDVYEDWVYPGGCLRPYMFDFYSPLMTAFNFAPPYPDAAGDKWEEIWEEHLAGNQPWGIGYISNPLQGPYWQERSLSAGHDRLNCAVYVMGGWADWYATPLLHAYSQLDVPKKALVGPWGHWYAEEEVAIPGPRIDSRLEYLKWFDYWLKEIDNGVMNEPPVTLFVKKYQKPQARMDIEEPGFWRSENEWPPARTDFQEFCLCADGALSLETPIDETAHSFEFDPGVGVTSGMHGGGGLMPWGTPIDQKEDELRSLVYTTEPLIEDLEITGRPKALLCVSSTAEIAYFRVKLIDVAPDGTSKLVRYGGLNATHRNSDSNPEILVPGELYELEVELEAMAYQFESGHRIRIAIAGADIQNSWPTPQSGTHSIHLGGGRSRIVLPVIPQDDSPTSQAPFAHLPPASPDKLATPLAYEITRDLLHDRTRVVMESELADPYGKAIVNSNFTVSSLNPADAELVTSADYKLEFPDHKVRVRADEVLKSDSNKFWFQSNVTIDQNGERKFQKAWSTEVPRQLA